MDGEDRRTADVEWKESVDKKLEEGKVTFGRILSELERNTDETQKISAKLDDHVTRYDEFTVKLQPIVEGMETLSPGIHFFGQLGKFIAWVGKWIRRIVVWIAPIGAFIWGAWEWYDHYGRMLHK